MQKMTWLQELKPGRGGLQAPKNRAVFFEVAIWAEVSALGREEGDGVGTQVLKIFHFLFELVDDLGVFGDPGLKDGTFSENLGA